MRLMPSGGSWNWSARFPVVTLSVGLLSPSVARAQSAPEEVPASSGVIGTAASPTPQSLLRVRAFVIGSNLNIAFVRGALGLELDKRFEFQFVQEANFHPERWYGAEEYDGDELRVWIVQENPSRVSVYFASPSQERFLVRRIDGLGNFGALEQEILSQVLESSLLSISSSSPEALTRREAARAAGAELESPVVPEKSFEPRLPPAPAPLENTGSTKFDLLAGYRLESTSTETNVNHGPRLRAGLEWRGKMLALGFGVLGGYTFETSYEDASLRLYTSSWTLRADVRVLMSTFEERFRFGPLVGFGDEFSWFRGTTTDTASWDTAAAGTFHSTIVTLSGIARVRLARSLELEAELGANVALQPASFEVAVAGNRNTWFEQSTLRPLGFLGLAYTPRFNSPFE